MLEHRGGSVPPASLRERHRAETQRALEEAAISLFGKKGFRDTSVDEIAAQAGVSRSTFFRYFGSKEALVMQRSHEMGAWYAELLRGRPPEEGPLKALEEALVALSQAAAETENLTQLRRQAALLRTDPVLADKDAEARAHWIGVISQILAERAGRADPTIEESLASAMLIEISRHVTESLSESDEPPEDEIRRHFEAARRLVS